MDKTEKKDIDGKYTGTGCVMLITHMTSRRHRRRRCDHDTTTATGNDHDDHMKLDDRRWSRSIAGRRVSEHT